MIVILKILYSLLTLRSNSAFSAVIKLIEKHLNAMDAKVFAKDAKIKSFSDLFLRCVTCEMKKIGYLTFSH